jgi:hypothetical protein
MLNNEQMRIGAQCMAAIFGGPGVFYAIESFHSAENALTGVIYLAIATALALASAPQSDHRTAGSGALAWCKAVIQPRRRRP